MHRRATNEYMARASLMGCRSYPLLLPFFPLTKENPNNSRLYIDSDIHNHPIRDYLHHGLFPCELNPDISVTTTAKYYTLAYRVNPLQAAVVTVMTLLAPRWSSTRVARIISSHMESAREQIFYLEMGPSILRSKLGRHGIYGTSIRPRSVQAK